MKNYFVTDLIAASSFLLICFSGKPWLRSSPTRWRNQVKILCLEVFFSNSSFARFFSFCLAKCLSYLISSSWSPPWEGANDAASRSNTPCASAKWKNMIDKFKKRQPKGDCINKCQSNNNNNNIDSTKNSQSSIFTMSVCVCISPPPHFRFLKKIPVFPSPLKKIFSFLQYSSFFLTPRARYFHLFPFP